MIDSHCHLDFDVFDGQRDELLAEANDAGVHTIINIGTDLESSARSVELAARHEMVYATVGFHPHDARKADSKGLDRIRELAGKPKVVGIGEIGLDYYRDLSPRPVQREAFRRQLELAVDLSLPVVIHSRESFEESVEIISDYATSLVGGVFHCFPGNLEDAVKVFELGFVISVGGIITFERAKMAAVAAGAPLDKIIIETDAPYLAPVPHRGKTNRPALVQYVCRKLADLQGLSLAETEKITDRTCRKLFRLVDTFGG